VGIALIQAKKNQITIWFSVIWNKYELITSQASDFVKCVHVYKYTTYNSAKT
jgi:hypothetical protein